MSWSDPVVAPRLHYPTPQQFPGSVGGPINVGAEPGKKRGEEAPSEVIRRTLDQTICEVGCRPPRRRVRDRSGLRPELQRHADGEGDGRTGACAPGCVG